jgi:prepilin-type N-terminal cleavage/methylation domain-containing protein
MRKVRGFTLIELMITVTVIGLLAAVAIPSYIKYFRRSMITEATMNLRRMYDGAAAYYVAEHTNATGAILAKQFPNDSTPTPPAIPCGVKHQPVPAEYDTPEWSALDFAVRDPYRYQYQFVNGTPPAGTTAFAAMMAQGNLDCDAMTSMFSRALTGSHDGISGDAGLYASNETE